MKAGWQRVLLVALIVLGGEARSAEGDLKWSGWERDLFARAAAENRFVLLDLEAVWCHWCHVMEETTYRDPTVVDLIRSRYLPVRVDQDAHPSLANRYEDYGWPATIIFAPDGTEIVKRRGYIPPDQFALILRAIIDDPSPGPSVIAEPPVEPVADAILAPALRKKILDNYFALYDKERGGWGTRQKFIDADSMEFALREALRGDAQQAAMARQTLDAAAALVDPVWGGVYQYSVGPTWEDQHYEKIMSFQASYLRAYSLAYGLWGEEEYLRIAQSIVRYLTGFLRSPQGGFYVSQDADVNREFTGRRFYALDDRERRAGPMPRIDPHVYARENGWAIAALALFAGITGDAAALDHAQSAAAHVLATHRLANGGFAHTGIASADSPAGASGSAPITAVPRATPAPVNAAAAKEAVPSATAPLYLGDNIHMARAFLALYSATAGRDWLAHARRTLEFVEQTFRHAEAGFVTTPVDPQAVGVFGNPVRQIDENLTVARTANLLFHYTGEARYRRLAEHAMRYLAAPAVVESRLLLPGILLAAEELSGAPLHVTVVGDRKDATAQGLHAVALAWPALFKRVEWWDRSEGPLANPDVQYPELDKAAAFLCTNKTCSLPMFTPPALKEKLHAFAAE